MAKVSIIIPAYNSENYISEAIESVLGQTYKDLEIIVVDDGSTDKTREIVKRYQVKYLYQENKGPAAARNRGIKEAKGSYIAFLDSDDIWMPEKLEIQLNKIKENPGYSFIHTDRIRIESDGEIQTKNNKAIPRDWVFNELIMKNFICCSSVLIKKECFDEVGLFEEDRKNRSEDYDMWLRMARKYRFGFIEYPLVKYRVNQNGYNRSDIKKAYHSEKDVFLKALQYYKGKKETLKKYKLNNLMYRMGHSFFYAKDYHNAFLAFLEAFKMRKLDFKSIGWYMICKIMIILKRDKSCRYV